MPFRRGFGIVRPDTFMNRRRRYLTVDITRRKIIDSDWWAAPVFALVVVCIGASVWFGWAR